MNDIAHPRSRSGFSVGIALGFVLATAAAVVGVAAWSAGLGWIDAGEPRALAALRERLEEQERRLARTEASAASAPSVAASPNPSADASWTEALRTAERAREEERARAERAAGEARAEVLALREELARTKQEIDALHAEIEEQAAARSRLESSQSALLERALAAEMRQREWDQRRGPGERVAPGPQVETLLGSSSFMEEIARNIPADLLGPQPAASEGHASAGATSTTSPSAGDAEALRRAEAEAAVFAQEKSSIDELRVQANRLLELDGFGETQLVRVGAVSDGVLRDVAFREVGPLGETRRFLAAQELRFEAFPGLRSLRAHLSEGYEQVGGGTAKPFVGGVAELTFADVRIDEWKALLDARGLWRATGAKSSGNADARFPAAGALANLNDLFARAKGTRKFVLRRLDAVHEGERWHGVELHQSEVGGGGLQVIYEAESAELWWDPAQKSAELRLEHGFQRRGAQRVPFFEKRARVFLGFEDEQGWDATKIPFHVVGPAAR